MGEPFGDVDLLRRYALILATVGVERGLVGPREAPRIWARHIVNCAVVASGDLVPQAATVIDVGSGAGLPGIVWAILRPDLHVTLLEPLLRRVTFLKEVVEELSLSARVQVDRARAEDYRGPRAQVVTARAVSSLPRLAAWMLPLTDVPGRVLALKGQGAVAEMAAAAEVIKRLGGSQPRLVLCGGAVIDPPTAVVVIDKS